MKILGICGYSGSGKTTLLKQLIPALKAQSIRLAVIKHSHHNIDIDKPGKDSYQLRQSGADQLIIASDNRWALITETPIQPPNLLTLANQFNGVDLVLVEGFKDEEIAKIICHRHDNQREIFYDKGTIAIATDTQLDLAITQLNINSIEEIAQFIIRYLSL